MFPGPINEYAASATCAIAASCEAKAFGIRSYIELCSIALLHLSKLRARKPFSIPFA